LTDDLILMSYAVGCQVGVLFLRIEGCCKIVCNQLLADREKEMCANESWFRIGLGKMGLLAFSGILAGAAGVNAQRIQIGPAQEVYSSSDLAFLSDSQHHTVTPNPNTPSPPYQEGFFLMGVYPNSNRFLDDKRNHAICLLVRQWRHRRVGLYWELPMMHSSIPWGPLRLSDIFVHTIVTVNADGKTAKDVLWIGGVAIWVQRRPRRQPTR